MTLALDTSAARNDAIVFKRAPLNVPLHIECPRAAYRAIAEACLGWEGHAAGLAPLRLRIGQSSALSGTGSTAIRADSTHLTVHGPGVVARADTAEGIAHCTVSAEYLNDPTALRQEVLESLTLMLLTQRDRTPVHASAFLVDGLAILLAGRTGAGKSCLARAADAAGFQVLSEDTVFVQLVPQLTVWGWPGAVHLLRRDAPDATGPTRSRGGMVKHVVPLRSASTRAIASDEAVLCILSPPVDSAPTLSPIPSHVVEERLWPLDEGFDLLPSPIAKAVAKLVERGAWDLRLSADPADAVRLLVANRRQLGGRGQPFE